MIEDFDTPEDKFKDKIRRIPAAVILGLQQEGRIGTQLTSAPCDEKQLNYAEKPIWFSKPGIDQFVKNHLNFTDSEWEQRYPSGVDAVPQEQSICYKKVEQTIGKLRKDKKNPLDDWNHSVVTGVWRLSFSNNSVSTGQIEVEPDPEPLDEHNKNSPYWLVSGSWNNWNHTLNNLPIRWGTTAKNLWEILKINDIVFCSASSKSERSFNKNGIFMIGKVTKKYHVRRDDHYFPENLNHNKDVFAYRFEIMPLKIVKTDDELLPLVDGLSTRQSINHITKNFVIDDLLNNLEDLWKIDLKSELNDEILRDDQPLPMLSSDDITSGYQKISDELLISVDTVSEIVVALLSGRHVLLAGAIGTGKTRLAKLIPEVFWSKWGGYYSEDYTATSDWSTQDVIGGIIPTMKDNDVQYVIQDGCVVDTVAKNWTSGRDGGRRTSTENPDSDTPFRGTWLVIDEFNRAEIDKAFGQLFTSLRTRKLKILTQQSGELSANLQIPKDYRIIGTLNTKDKHFVFDLSDALKSRFAYIEVGIPQRKYFETEMYYAMKNALYDLEPEYKFEKIIFNHNEKKIDEEQSDKEFYDKVLAAYHVLDTVRIFKKLGTAILKLIYQNLIVGDLLLSDSEKSLDDSLTLNLISQLEPESMSDLKLIRALLTDRLVSDLQPSSINTIEGNNYFESLEKSFDYLQIQNKVALLENIKNNPSADMLGEFNQQYPITGNKLELTLEKWFSALDDLIKFKKF